MAMEVVYSTQSSGFERGKQYRNPKYFQAPLGKPEKVTVIGDWPRVVEAYEALGVKVEVVKTAKPRLLSGSVQPPPQSLVDRVSPKADLPALRAEYQDVIGKRPYMGWKEDKLREKIAEARSA